MLHLNCWPAPEVCFQATLQAGLLQDSSEVCSAKDVFVEGAKAVNGSVVPVCGIWAGSGVVCVFALLMDFDLCCVPFPIL